ncbi:MAG TPA: hypothetical protein VLX31_12735 [Streptosporangiaceae bacterium]|nr:hypothetical protein [Streptosporangiaceae bacterium]
MASQNIYMSTTDIIPEFRNKVVRKSEVTWGGSGATMMSAYRGLEKWVRENNYDAIIGVHFMMCAKPDGEIAYLAYGTAVSWEY